MVNELHIKLAQTAKRLIEKNGRLVVLINSDRTNTDAAVPWRRNLTPSDGGTEISVKAVYVYPSGDTRMGSEIILDGISLNKKYKYLIFSEDSSPGNDYSKFSYVQDGAELYKINTHQELKPGEKTILHLMELDQ